MTKKQTAVEWLQEALSLTFEQEMQFEGLFQQAKAMEKQQIINAYWDGGEDIPMISKQCEEYYNEKFEA
jgi:hypothetical protein